MKIIRLSSGLGNQLFMYAFFLHVKDKYKNEGIYFDDKYYQNDLSGRKPELDLLFPNYPTKKLRFNPAGEKHIVKAIYKKLYCLCNRIRHINEVDYDDTTIYAEDCYFDGYWQCHDFVKLLPKSVFFPKVKIPQEMRSFEDKILNLHHTVSIHFRRTDYFSPRYIDRFGVCTKQFYQNAMAMLEEEVQSPTYVVFSDDMEWVKSNITFRHQTIYIPNHNINSYWYIYLMSLCSHNIIANSTFSWWGAYLNNNAGQKVYGPDKWTFDSEKTLMCDNWIKVATR